MDNSHIKICSLNGSWVVRTAGAVIGETKNALELIEGDYKPVVYFPREDISLAFLDKSDKITHCPYKGDATYYSIAAKSRTIENAAWSYENPLEGMERIKGFLAFFPDMTTVERL